MQTDPRGPRLAAALTAIVLALVLATGSCPLLGAQTLVFALGSFGGLRLAPYVRLFQALVLPRLAPPSATEDERPLRLDQGVLMVFAAVGTLGYCTEVTWLGVMGASTALTAAFANAVFGYSVGCELYPLVRHAQGRLTSRA
ncbi:DUF4395 domain-containing protein [Kitasatospora xanthocidica]|uniref:DUF4395 domain-containing protein n=1 Tax=Kitasatospora xanthocidica TaxID=83382 RepID=A0A372ZK90_9ACTN|nr:MULTISPECIES: DUF4395 domain-containing protein [Streptomycetaceae]OKH97125.1 hypothetical protein AMK13_39425 [Streptomyces sp. CB02056]RGD56141.1 DUF4395 domain-containing protein [Kitasatospora xanthocidica]